MQDSRLSQEASPTAYDLGCRWYVADEGRIFGPFGYEELLERAKTGELSASNHVWRGGFDHWLPISGRPELLEVLPTPSSLSLGVPTLEAASALSTLDVGAELAEATASLPPLPDATWSLEEEALEALARAPTPPAATAVSLGPAPAALIARSLGTLPTLSDEDIAELEGIRELRAGRRRRGALVASLVVCAAGLGALVVATREPTPAFGPSHPDRPVPALIPDPGPPQPAKVETASFRPPEPAALPAARDPSPQLASTTAPRRQPRKAPADFGWLAGERPEPEPAPPKREAPPRVRVAAKKAEVRLDLPVALPDGLSQESVGRVVAAGLSDLARCARFDRLSRGLPAGSKALIVVSSEGSVRRVKVTGMPSGVEGCIARTARMLRFAPFTKPTQRVELAFGRSGTVRAELLE